MKTIVYVDGLNLYYAALRGTPFKWLDPRLPDKIPGTRLTRPPESLNLCCSRTVPHRPYGMPPRRSPPFEALGRGAEAETAR